MRQTARNFRYRNRDGAWLDFHREGLTLDADGALELISVPLAEPPVTIDTPPAPGAIAVSDSGDVYFTQDGRIARRGCTGDIEQLETEAPNAMAFSERRGALIAAYSDRIAIFDLPLVTHAETWYGFTNARAIAVDSGGRVYAGDDSGIRRFFLTGQPDPSFQVDDVMPSALAVAAERLYALEGGRIVAFDIETMDRMIVTEDLAPDASGLAAWNGVVYCGAGNSIQVLQDGARGTALGYMGPLAALAIHRGLLWVHPGSGSPVSLRLRGGYGTSGSLWSNALDASGRTVEWNRVRAWVDLPEGSAIQFYVHTSDEEQPAPEFPGEWEELPPDVTDFHVGRAARYIRVGAILFGDGRGTPRLRQVRTDFDQEGYAELLPEIYRPTPRQNLEAEERERIAAETGDWFLERFLGAFRSLYEDAADRIDGLSAMLDPDAIDQSNLAWLAGFLALELPEDMSAGRRRQRIREAFASYAERGTVAGLRKAILAETGVHAVIQEPIAKAAWWQMPARSPDCSAGQAWSHGAEGGLGIGTVFAGAAPQGAILGAGAELDRSHLITNEEYGMPLFADLAHRFNVLLYEGEIACAERRALVEAVIEREKPAHTAAHLCIIQPAFRVGWQGILGVDTVVGGANAATRLGEGALRLGGPEAGRIGESAITGVATRL
jgi:phage tail-like protein